MASGSGNSLEYLQMLSDQCSLGENCPAREFRGMCGKHRLDRDVAEGLERRFSGESAPGFEVATAFRETCPQRGLCSACN